MIALFRGTQEVEEIARVIGTASFTGRLLADVKAEEVVCAVQVLVKDIVADAGPFGFFVCVPDLAVEGLAEHGH